MRLTFVPITLPDATPPYMNSISKDSAAGPGKRIHSRETGCTARAYTFHDRKRARTTGHKALQPRSLVN